MKARDDAGLKRATHVREAVVLNATVTGSNPGRLTNVFPNSHNSLSCRLIVKLLS